MENNIIIGTELLEYTQKLSSITSEITLTKDTATQMLEILSNEDAYEGEARETVQTFLEGMTAQLTRLELLYVMAAKYAATTYTTMYESDEALACWYLKALYDDN